MESQHKAELKSGDTPRFSFIDAVIGVTLVSAFTTLAVTAIFVGFLKETFNARR